MPQQCFMSCLVDLYTSTEYIIVGVEMESWMPMKLVMMAILHRTMVAPVFVNWKQGLFAMALSVMVSVAMALKHPRRLVMTEILLTQMAAVPRVELKQGTHVP